jgi:uncharacterized protein (DUF1015 family)
MRLRGFSAWRPDPAVAAQLASPPYDVVTFAEARQQAAGNPLSFLHVVRAEIDLPAGADPYAPAVYARALANFQSLQAAGHLRRDPDQAVYVYQQQMGGHVQRGVTALCHIEDYAANVIRKHEKTRKAKEDDRLTLNRTLGAHPGLVFLAVRDDARLQALLDAAAAAPPLYDFTAPDGVRHTAWKVVPDTAWRELFADVPVAYVADGHHRSASAWRLGMEQRAANSRHTGEEDYNWFPAVIFPAASLRILPYNRVVRDLAGQSAEAFLAALRQAARVGPGGAATPARPGLVNMYLAGQWHALELPPPAAAADPIAHLDVSRLQDQILAPLLGIGDPRTDERIDFIGGIRGADALARQVDSGAAAVAFAMHPVTMEQLMAIADAGAIMPPKSTWFEPKLRSGLFIHQVLAE